MPRERYDRERFGCVYMFLEVALELGLYTRLPSPIFYGVRHKSGGVSGGDVYCAIVAIVLPA